MLVTPQITWSLLSFTAFWSFVFHDTDFVPKRFLSILLLVHPVQWIAFCVVIRWIDIPDCTLSFVGVSSLKVKIQVCTLWLMKQQDSALYEFDAWFSLHTGKNSSSTSAFLSGVRYSPDGKSIWNKFFLSWGGNIYHPLQYFSCFFVPNVIFCVVSLQDTNFKIMAWQWASSQGVWQDSAIFLDISGSEIFHQISGWSNHLRFFFLTDKSHVSKNQTSMDVMMKFPFAWKFLIQENQSRTICLLTNTLRQSDLQTLEN